MPFLQQEWLQQHLLLQSLGRHKMLLLIHKQPFHYNDF